MIQGYKNVAVIYGGSGRKYAELFNKKLNETSEIERYPICARIINERILTRELLNDVMKLFKKSEFCVAFLTKEDCCLNENNKKYRLRQNVVFELGMALIELGRERVILLSDFDVKETDFDLPSDMSSLEILKFCHGNFENVLNDVIEKLLKLSQISVFTEEKSDTVPKYDYLLTRTNYRIDYENIFSEHPHTLLLEGEQFFTNTLEDWADECKNLKHYDEKCIYLLERIGLLPVFGKTPEAIQFMEKAEEIVESYKESDINYYGDSKILDFTNNLVQCVIDYTIIKTKNMNNSERTGRYKELLQNFLAENISDISKINPLIKVVYYDYLGLTYLQIYRAENSKENLEHAKQAFLKSLEYVSSVDMAMKVWRGFLTFNLARLYSEMNDLNNAKNITTMLSQYARNGLNLLSIT